MEESDRRQEVCAVIMNTGVQLRRSVQVVMSTRPGTALGKRSSDGIVRYGSFNEPATNEFIPLIMDLNDNSCYSMEG